MVSVPRSVFLAVVTAAAYSSELDADDREAVLSAVKAMDAVAVGTSQDGPVLCPLRAAGLWPSNLDYISPERQRFYRGFDRGMILYLDHYAPVVRVLPGA
jgi:hypothetical protein